MGFVRRVGAVTKRPRQFSQHRFINKTIQLTFMKKKILVVEDFGSIRNFVCDTLNRKGYETVGAANIKEALSTLTTDFEGIHLVLTDYNMPDGTGYDLLKKIKASTSTANIPVIFLTTESSPD